MVSVLADVSVGVYITMHDDVKLVALGVRVQGEVANVPVPLVVKPTVPVGASEGKPGLTGELSDTVTVHVVAVPELTVAGRHETLVVVGRTVAVRVVDPLLDA
jgi:hypothetical protein